jgi:4-alpha-glucanotransferase
LWNYLARPGSESSKAAAVLMGLAWSSVAAVSMAPLQDLLNLGPETRMNVGPHDEWPRQRRCNGRLPFSTMLHGD